MALPYYITAPNGPDDQEAAARMALRPLPALAAPALPPVMAAPPSPVAPTGPPALPAISMSPQATADTAERNRLVSTGAGVTQVHNSWLRGLAKAGDVTASVFGALGPLEHAIATTIPGTSLHHAVLVHQADARVAQDQADAQGAATLAQTEASTRHTNDVANALENPAPAAPEYKTDANGNIVAVTGTTATPVTGPDGKPLGTPAKPATNAFELWHQQNPDGTVADFNQLESKPLTQAEADSLNSITNPLATKHGLPAGQFKAGMPHADALQLQSALYGAIGKQQGDTHIVIQQAGQAAQQSRNSPLDTSDPATSAAVDSVGTGKLKLSDVFGRGATTAQKVQFVAAVQAKYPSYNSGDHDIENKARAYYTGGGKGGQTLTAFNTAQTHLDILRQASDELHNGNITAFNSLSQRYAQATGDPAPTDFNAVKNAVKGEVARALTGNVTVSEQAELDKDFNNASSPRQIAGVAHKYIQLIDGKKQAMQSNYAASQEGRPDFGGGSSAQPVEEYVRVNGKLVKK